MSKQTPDTDTTVAKESRLTDKQKKIADITCLIMRSPHRKEPQ